MKLNYFNFKKYKDSILMTNDFGTYMFVSKENFQKILSLDVDRGSELYKSLIDKKMIYDESDLEYSSINKYALREIKGHVNVATSLHIFVVTNLTLLNDDMLDFFVQYSFGISTSVDGSELVHNNNRPYADGSGTFEKVINSVERVRKAGLQVGAIETTTRFSLSFPKEIVHTYVDMGFESIFIRPLTPLGKAAKSWEKIGYSSEEFIKFYQQALDELIEINKKGRFIKEDHAAILLRRIRGDFMNYMELRSPCGAGVGQLAYYADGNIFTCDEGRMLHEMGQSTFQLGNVYNSTYADLINNSVCKTVCASSILETIPTCCDCVYQPYCGTCPVVNYALDGDVIEKQPRGYKCRVYSGILDYLFSKFYENDRETMQILNSWSD